MAKKQYVRRIAFLGSIVLGCIILSQQIVFAEEAQESAIVGEYVPNELVAAAESLEEAEQIAEMYNITLVSYAYGIAQFVTTEVEERIAESQSVESILAPELYYNRIYTLYETDEIIQFSEDVIEGDEVSHVTAAYLYHNKEIDTVSAHEITKGANVVVAVIDTGVDTDHDELKAVISANSYNSYTQTVGIEAVEDDHSHGTHVCGIIAAAVDDDNDIYGVAPTAELLVIKADRPSDNNFETTSLLRAINYAVENGADVINMSLGASYTSGASELERSTIANAVSEGVVVVCAAGNDTYEHAGYPAAYDETIAVSAVGSGYGFASTYSNYGPEIDIAAPGSTIYSSVLENSYGYKSGTSMACPVITGVVALIKSLYPNETPDETAERLYATAREVGELGWDEYYGNGVVNAYSAVLGVDNLVTVTYDFNDEERDAITTMVVSGGTLIEPEEPAYLKDDREFLGWLQEGGDTYFDFKQEINSDITLSAQWGEPSFSVSGLVKVYTIQGNTIIDLKQDGIVKYSIELETENVFGQVNQYFTLAEVEAGTYDLVINKAGHLEYTISNIVVSDKNVDLTTHSNENITTMTMLVGDVNENGVINADDVNAIRSSLNYLKNSEEANNILADVNGNGVINADDVNTIRSGLNYLKSLSDCMFVF